MVGGVAIIRDVTERKIAEASALDDHRRLAFHVENTPLAVIEWDHEFRVLRWSPAAQKLFGWKAEEVLGKRFSDWEFVVPGRYRRSQPGGPTTERRQGTSRHLAQSQLHEARNDTPLRVVQLRALQRSRQTDLSAFARARRDSRDAHRGSAAKVGSAVSFAVRVKSAGDVGLRSDDTSFSRSERCGGAPLRLLACGVSRHDDQGHSSARGRELLEEYLASETPSSKMRASGDTGKKTARLSTSISRQVV